MNDLGLPRPNPPLKSIELSGGGERDDDRGDPSK
jgi:hypothetical protein